MVILFSLFEKYLLENFQFSGINFLRIGILFGYNISNDPSERIE